MQCHNCKKEKRKIWVSRKAAPPARHESFLVMQGAEDDQHNTFRTRMHVILITITIDACFQKGQLTLIRHQRLLLEILFLPAISRTDCFDFSQSQT